MKKALLIISLALSILVFQNTLVLANAEKIIAVVNDKPITNTDLRQVKRMVIFLNNIREITPEIDAQLNRMVLDSLINQALMQEQKQKFQIKIPDEEINQSIHAIEDSNKLPSGYLKKMLSDNHIDYRLFKNKIESDLLLKKISQQMFYPNVLVSKDEIDKAVIDSNLKLTKFNLQIFTSNDLSRQSYKNMTRLNKKLKGCDKLPKPSEYQKFATLANVSENINDLPPAARSVVKGLKNNQASGVIKGEDHFQIFMVCSYEIDDLSNDENTFVIDSIGNTKLNKQLQRFYDNLRKKAYIKVYN
jgi:parvulin-like peptidyl-prolyl isomerase